MNKESRKIGICRDEVEEIILEAIKKLEAKGIVPTASKILSTAVNPKGFSLRLHHIYNSRHISKLKVNGTVFRKKAAAMPFPSLVNPTNEAKLSSKTTQSGRDIEAVNLLYKDLGITLSIKLKSNSADEIFEAIESLNFLHTKSVQLLRRLERKVEAP